MIALIGLDYRYTTAEFRGRVGFPDDRLPAALRALASVSVIDEAIILSTCNRTEVYVATEEPLAATHAVRRFLAATYSRGPATVVPAFTTVPTTVKTADAPAMTPHPEEAPADDDVLPSVLTQVLYEYEGTEVVRHLCKVAAGLESMVIGEAQILGQVREALAAAEAVHSAGEELRAVFTTALKVGKRARAETRIGRADVSIASVAISVAEDSLGSLSGRSALLIGAGKTSGLCGERLRERGIEEVILANRTSTTAAELAERLHATTIPLSDLSSAISTVDLIISATAAPHHILKTADVARGTLGRHNPLVIFDLAVPPDVEEDVGLLPAVSLHSLDMLRGIETDASATDGLDRDAEVAHMVEIVEHGVREYVRSRTMRLAVPGIAALRRHVDHSEQAELERALARLEHLSDEDQAVVTRFGNRLVDKMFHHLVSRIRSLAEYDEVPPDVTMRVLARLFADPADEQSGDDEG